MTLALCARVPIAVGAPAIEERVDEYRLKAAILYNLARFVDWPTDSFTDASAPLRVCVLGVDPFGSALDDALRGHVVGGRAIETRRIAEPETGCHLLYVSASERSRVAAIVESVRRTAVLTVSDQVGFASVGGVVELFTEGDRIRFCLNTAAAERARLYLSVRLVALASNQPSAGAAR
ncbi:MAG: YfiR family protein [Vicinamibacterales bacterium]